MRISIAAAFFVLLPAVSTAADEFGRYCYSKELFGYTGTGQAIDLGQFEAWITITSANGKMWVEFEDTMPDSHQSVLIRQTQLVSNPGSFTFQFMDGWGNSGEGFLALHGDSVDISWGDITSNVPNNAARNYANLTLTKSQCSAGAL